MKILKTPGTGKLLQRILADPSLPDKIKQMEPKALATLIDQVGLEDCGEIVALATPGQIGRIFDEDLWQSEKPGGDEEFDPIRFGLWIEILLELGPASATEKLAELDPDFLTMALSQLILVTYSDELRSQASSHSLDKVIDSSFFHELEDFLIFSREPRSWDAVLTLLVELDREHHSFLRRILETCAHFSSELIDDEGGLESVLTSEEQLKGDVAYEREKRREAEGYVTPADARAFLKLAAGPLDAEDHISPDRLRHQTLSPRSLRASVPIDAGEPALIAADHRFPKVRAMLSQSPDASEYRSKLEDLNYLANVLVSGWQLDGRSPRPGEAAQTVLETCERGLSRRERARSLIEAFRAGWVERGP